MALTTQERLKDLRVERGLTLQQLAEQTHLPKSALGSYEADDFKDMEGIAATQIQNLNAWVDVARAEIMEKYQPGHDKTAGVREGDYFSSRVHYDTDAVMEDIWEAHRGRNDSAPENTIADEPKRDLEEVTSFKGRRAEQLLMVFCKQTKLRYNKLTEEEKQWLIRIVQKSELAKGYVPQRGKRK